MGDKSNIEWTDATWNPVRGCAKVSEGCRNCYAMRQAHRSSGAGGAYQGLTEMINGRPQWNGKIRTVPELLDAPLRWKKPRRIFVNSMSDLFHESVPDEFIYQVFKSMALSDRHTFQVLTKRPDRMFRLLDGKHRGDGMWQFATWSLPNVWLGVSVEDQATADERIPPLLQTPAAVRFISAEPLLGPINFEHETEIGVMTWLKRYDLGSEPCHRIDWVIAGGESGPGARPSHPDWFRSLRDQCQAAGVAFFFKQWGAHRIGEYDPTKDVSIRWQDGTREWHGDHADIKYSENWFDGVIAWPASKKKTGRQLDGREWNEFPR